MEFFHETRLNYFIILTRRNLTYQMFYYLESSERYLLQTGKGQVKESWQAIRVYHICLLPCSAKGAEKIMQIRLISRFGAIKLSCSFTTYQFRPGDAWPPKTELTAWRLLIRNNSSKKIESHQSL